ncbi:MAG: carboxypeptidase regulatory-like domain-containing protein [Candidatus Aquirickettsiella gammari]
MSKKNSVFKKTLVAHALTVAFGFGVVAVSIPTEVMAQSNAAGSIFGKAKPGATVQILNSDNGVRRTATADASGRFQITALPIGTYKVDLMSGGKVEQSTTVDVVLGQGTEATFAAAAGAVQVVQVSGARKAIDISSTNNGASFTARQLENLPVAKSVEAIVQLAPNTTRGDTRFAGNGASFGGGAVTENSYYINGFPVTNPLTGFGASQLPYGAIAEAQVLTGGFGAEFGRSIGGVVNVITKSGKNRWEAGATVSWSPDSLRSDPKDIDYPKTGRTYNAATDGTLYLRRNQNTADSKLLGGYVSGPIIQDKLFMMISAEQTKTDQGFVNGTRTSTSNANDGWNDTKATVNRYLAKFDWNIADEHRLEFMSIGDSPVLNIKRSGYDYATGARVGSVTSEQTNRNINDNGNQLNALKYVGEITQDLTLTAMYGQAKSKHETTLVGYNPAMMGVTADPANRVPGLSYNNPQSFTSNVPGVGSNDLVKSARIDLEYKLNQHTIRAGFDKSKTDSLGGATTPGGGSWAYLKTDNPNIPIPVSGGTIPPTASGGGYGTQGYYVSKSYYSDVTESHGEQSAFYIEDKYQVTKNLMVTGGLRYEAFSNKNKLGEKFLDQPGEINPRVAASWDVNGDASLKVFATAGRYSVPIPTNIGLRAAGATYNATQYYTYTGTDANGQPQGLKALTNPLSPNNEFGQPKDAKSFAAKDMKPTYQDEITFGFEKQLAPEWNSGARMTYRTLKSTIDDLCDARPFEAWAARTNTTITNDIFGHDCYLINPGSANTMIMDIDGKGTYKEVALTVADLKFEKPVRTYTALDLFLEHPFRNGWYGKVNYTWSRNYGNTEGQVRSDNGQADVSVTATWDYPEIMRGAKGLLPNDRTHQIKAFGFYQLNSEWSVGGNLLLASGRPRSCLGGDPNPGDSPNYNNQAFFCFGETRAQNVLLPRGKIGNLPFDKRLDLNVTYKPAFLGGFAFKMDVFNITNTQTLQNVVEAYNSGTRMSANYERPISYTNPRSVRFTGEYNHKF